MGSARMDEMEGGSYTAGGASAAGASTSAGAAGAGAGSHDCGSGSVLFVRVVLFPRVSRFDGWKFSFL